MTSLFTGDHAEINALTRAKREERQKIFSNLPQKTQELLIPKPSFFDGINEDAEDWMQKTKQFATFNQMEFSFALDMLLRGDAKQLWEEYNSSNDPITNEEVEKWFIETFSSTKSIYDKVKELSVIKQRKDEKYRNFEIRVKKMVTDVFQKKFTIEEITRAFILQGLQSEKLRESFALDPTMSDERRRELATNLEKIISHREVNVMKPTFSQVVSKPVYYNQRTEGKNKSFDNQRNSLNFKASRNNSTFERSTERDKYLSQSSNNGNFSNQTIRPQRSMKMIAMKFYNQCRGKAPPRDEILHHGACFCCGNMNHRRNECPLRNKCLICGKSGHYFKDCYLVSDSHQNQRILCIHDEEQSMHENDNLDVIHDIDSNEIEKNPYQLPVAISSVELSQ